jgi:DNA-binding winged helix-turn-helix (wHTH) protein/tetratricopeptide (TPR) repeat protein
MYRFGRFEIDPARRRFIRDGSPVAISPKALDMLLVLVERRGQRITRAELLDKVWPQTAVTEQNLNQCIAVLRKALGDDPRQPEYIATLPGHGYSFIADVAVVISGSNYQAVSGSGRSAPANRVPQIGAPVSSLRSRLQLRRLLGFAVLSVAAVMLIGVAVHRLNQRSYEQLTGATPGSVSAAPRRSVAVLGFENLSRRPEDDWLSTALAEMMTTEMAAGGKLRTIPGDSVARVRSDLNLTSPNNLAEAVLRHAGQNLGADLIVSGAYILIGPSNQPTGQIRLDVKVEDAATAETIASASATGAITDLFSVVAQAGSTLRAGLDIEPETPVEASQARAAMPANPEAGKLYAEGLARLHHYDSLGARNLLERAVAGDPAFPLSHLALADAYFALGQQDRAAQSARRASELSSHLSRELQLEIQARLAQASGDQEKSIRIYQSLLTFYPDNPEYALHLADSECLFGKAADALKVLDRLRKMPSPISSDPRIDLAEVFAKTMLSDYHGAFAPAQRAAATAKAQGARWFYAKALLAQAGILTTLQNFKQATPLDSEASQICTTLGDLSCVARIYRQLGVM